MTAGAGIGVAAQGGDDVVEDVADGRATPRLVQHGRTTGAQGRPAAMRRETSGSAAPRTAHQYGQHRRRLPSVGRWRRCRPPACPGRGTVSGSGSGSCSGPGCRRTRRCGREEQGEARRRRTAMLATEVSTDGGRRGGWPALGVTECGHEGHHGDGDEQDHGGVDQPAEPGRADPAGLVVGRTATGHHGHGQEHQAAAGDGAPRVTAPICHVAGARMRP